MPRDGCYCLSLDVSVKKVVIQPKCCQGLLKIQEIILDHIEHVMLEARVTRKTTLTTVNSPQLARPVGQTLHSRQNPVRQVLPLILQLHNSYKLENIS